MGLVGFQEDGKKQISLSTTNDDFHDTRRYVFTCAVFASLNSVLLGYGLFPFSISLSLFISLFLLVV